MGDTRITRGPYRAATVREDWLAWLPEDKDRFFDSIHSELEVSYAVLSVSLHEGLTLCEQGKLPLAREQSAMFVALFDRLSGRLHEVLRVLGEYGRHFDIAPLVTPLRPGYFRGANAQRAARASYLVSGVLFSARARFLRKVRALLKMVAGLQDETRRMARAAGEEAGLCWTCLEVFHYDLNTCLRETTIVLKSFLCVLPSAELATFEGRLLSRIPQQIQFFLDDRPRF
jgi:hypothetical protein